MLAGGAAVLVGGTAVLAGGTAVLGATGGGGAGVGGQKPMHAAALGIRLILSIAKIPCIRRRLLLTSIADVVITKPLMSCRV